MTEFLPPRAPDSSEPGRWDPRPPDGEGHARMVVASRMGAPPVLQAGEHPPRNAHALWALGVAIAGVALLIVSVGISFVVTLPVEGIALALARQGRRRAEAEGIGGLRAARAARVVAIVGIVLSIVAAVAWIVIVILDPNVSTDLGRDSPSAPTDLSVLWGVAGRGHL